MHFSITLTLFALLPSLALNTVASPTDASCISEYCPRAPGSSAPLNLAVAITPSTSALTNAQRLARGFPIKPPRRRATISARGSTVVHLPRASPLPKVTLRGVIQVTNAVDGQILGYISKNSFSGAQYRYQPSIGDALIVTFPINIGAITAVNVRITSENSDVQGFPLLALVQGRDANSVNFAPGSFNYGYVAGMAEPGTGPGSTPATSPSNTYTSVTGLSRASISDVWSYNAVSMALTPHWVNSDGFEPTTATFAQGTALYVGGDRDAFFARYPAPVISIRFTFVPLP